MVGGVGGLGLRRVEWRVEKRVVEFGGKMMTIRRMMAVVRRNLGRRERGLRCCWEICEGSIVGALKGNQRTSEDMIRYKDNRTRNAADVTCGRETCEREHEISLHLGGDGFSGSVLACYSNFAEEQGYIHVVSKTHDVTHSLYAESI